MDAHEPAQPASPPRRGRFTSVLGLIAAVALAAAVFMPWWKLAGSVSELHAEAARQLEAREGGTARDRELVDLVGGIARRGALAGSDVAKWGLDRSKDATDATTTPVGRDRLAVTAWLIYGVAGAGVLLALLFLLGIARGIGALALGLSLPAGLVGVGFGLLVRAIAEESTNEVLAGVGLGGHALLGAGGLLVAVGVLGVTRTTWWKAWLLAILSASGLLAWTYHAMHIDQERSGSASHDTAD
ncbi:MAG: hypothetical protein AB7T63_01405 [Planctomycetota bacterium]